MISLSAQMGLAQEVINIYNDYRLDKPFNIHETIGDRKYKVHCIKIVRFIWGLSEDNLGAHWATVSLFFCDWGGVFETYRIIPCLTPLEITQEEITAKKKN